MLSITTARDFQRLTGIGLAAGVLFISLYAFATRRPHRHEIPANSVNPQIVNRAVTLCADFYGPNSPTGFAKIYDGYLRAPGRKPVYRKTSCVVVQAEQRKFFMVFNLVNGNLIQVGSLDDRDAETPAVAPIDTPAEALDVAARRLQAMQLLPANADLSLAGPFERTNGGKAWTFIVAAKTPGASTPPRFRVRLSRYGGVPLLVMNLQETLDWTKGVTTAYAE